jgi:hypothetical protein
MQTFRCRSMGVMVQNSALVGNLNSDKSVELWRMIQRGMLV